MSEDAPETPPPRQRFGERVAAASRRGREELTRKGGIPDQAHGFFRRWFRKVWEARGGGLYAVGFAVTFLYLEIKDILFDDVPTLASMNVFSAEIAAFVIDFIIDTFMNMLSAFMWPVWVIQWQIPWGIALLVAAFFLFPRFVKQPMEHWLFEGRKPPPPRERNSKKREEEKKRRAKGE